MITRDKTSYFALPSNSYQFRGSWFQLIRPLTLTGTLTPILVGTAFAAKAAPIRWDLFFALLIAAMLIQATTNMLNDYFDFQNGQDKEKWLQQTNTNSIFSPTYEAIPYMAGFLLVISISIGAWLAIESSLWILPIGIISILAGIKYSLGTHSFSAIGLGECIAFIFLGIVVTVLGYVVQGHALNGDIIMLALPFALLIAAMILTNNIRDIKKDLPFRKTIAILLGQNQFIRLLTIILTSTYAIMGVLIILGIVPVLGLLTLFALPFAFRLLYAFRKHAPNEEMQQVMKWAALHHWVFGILYAIVMWIA